MQIVEIEVDEKTLSEVDEAIKVLGENREDVFRQTFLDLAKRKKREAEIARQYAEAYGKHPQTAEEIGEWEEVQYWENE